MDEATHNRQDGRLHFIARPGGRGREGGSSQAQAGRGVSTCRGPVLDPLTLLTPRQRNGGPPCVIVKFNWNGQPKCQRHIPVHLPKGRHAKKICFRSNRIRDNRYTMGNVSLRFAMLAFWCSHSLHTCCIGSASGGALVIGSSLLLNFASCSRLALAWHPLGPRLAPAPRRAG